MTAFWMNVLWSMSSQFYWEKETGNLALYIIAPDPMMAILLGMALGGLVATTLRAVCHHPAGQPALPCALRGGPAACSCCWSSLLAMAALYGMGMMTASLFLLLSREAWHIANLAQEPIFLVSGFYFPIKNFPFWVAAAASIIPLTLGLDAMRQLAFATGPIAGLSQRRARTADPGGAGVIFLLAARFLLDYMEKLAIREGRLTESRR